MRYEFTHFIQNFSNNPPPVLNRPLTKTEQVIKKIKQIATRLFLFSVVSISFFTTADLFSRLFTQTHAGLGGVISSLAFGAIYTIACIEKKPDPDNLSSDTDCRFVHYYD